VAAIPQVLAELGYEPTAVLEELGFDPAMFDNPDLVIPYVRRSELIQQCVHKTQCAHFGLLIGQQTGLSAFGLMGYLVQQSPNVVTALKTLVHYAHLHVRGAVISFEEVDDEAFLGYSIYQPDVEAYEQIADGAVAIAYNILRKLCGPNWSPTDVNFAHRKPADVRPYQQFFKASLKFDAERNGVLFSAKWLQQPVLGADTELHRLLQKQIDQIETHCSGDFVEQVQRVLHTSLFTQKTTADHIAALFSLHPRTLHRRLKANGTSFQQLVDNVRFEIARQSLENSSLEVTQIAAMLHYADPSAFTRAFRRWSGTTPALWRKQNHKLDA
jgi:AraC-like DNA-binding protein